jgi:hypothetical protein
LAQGARLSQHFAGRWANHLEFAPENEANSREFANCSGSAPLSEADPEQFGKHAR